MSNKIKDTATEDKAIEDKAIEDKKEIKFKDLSVEDKIAFLKENDLPIPQNLLIMLRDARLDLVDAIAEVATGRFGMTPEVVTGYLMDGIDHDVNNTPDMLLSYYTGKIQKIMSENPTIDFIVKMPFKVGAVEKRISIGNAIKRVTDPVKAAAIKQLAADTKAFNKARRAELNLKSRS
jgi:hypothetical protein